MKNRIVMLSLVFIFVSMSVGVFCQVVKEETKKSQGEVLSEMIDAGQYREALEVVNKALAKKADNPDMIFYKIRALKGLGDYRKVAILAMKSAVKYKESLEFRYYAGDAAFNMGLMAPALNNWKPLLKDKDWAATGCKASVKALLAEGKEDQARNFIDEVISNFKNPPIDLLKLKMNMTRSRKVGIETAEMLIKADPANREEYEGFKKLFSAANGDELYRMDPVKSYPLEIPMKMKSERKTISSLDWYGANAGSSTITTTPSLVVPVSINGGKKTWVQLDSGSDVVLISPEWAEQLGVKGMASAQYIGLGVEGSRKTSWVMLKKLEVGPVVFHNVPAMVISKKEDFFKDIGGILPFFLFRDNAICFDKRHRKLTLHASGTSPAAVMGDRSFKVKSLWVYGEPYAQVSLNDTPPHYFLIDTGAFATFLNKNKVATIGIKANVARYPNQMTTGLSGSASAEIADNIKFRLGNTNFNMRRVYVQEMGSHGGIDSWGFIGQMNILRILKIYFDYKTGTVAFCPAD